MATTEAEHVDTAPKSDIFEEALRGELVKFLTPTVAGVHSALDSVEERQDELMLKINELINSLHLLHLFTQSCLNSATLRLYTTLLNPRLS